MTHALPVSHQTFQLHDNSIFSISCNCFEQCVGSYLLNSEKYSKLVDLIFEKLSYYHQAVACMQLHLVYGEEAKHSYMREDKPFLQKMQYQQRNSEPYRALIARYVSKYAERYCEYILTHNKDGNELISTDVLYVYMESCFSPSLETFNNAISDWICRKTSNPCAFLCAYIQHLLAKVYDPRWNRPGIYIPQYITKNLPSVFALMSNIGEFTHEERCKIKLTIQQVLPELRSRNQEFSEASGIPEVIERMQACLEQIETIRQAKGEVVEG